MYSRSTGPIAARPSPPRENGVRPVALQLNVVPNTIAADNLAQQIGPPIPKLRHKVAKLVPGVRHRQRLRTLRHTVPGEHLNAFLARQSVGVQTQQIGQLAIDAHEPRRPHRSGIHPRIKLLGQPRIRILKPKPHGSRR